jgi:sulfide:quinone oxidoreductase
MKRIVILGAGTAGTIMANRLRRLYRSDIKSGELQITIVDQDNQHVYQPGLLFIPFGIYTPEDTVKPRRPQVSDDVRYLQAGIERVEPEHDTVYLDDGTTLAYDVLIVATGTDIAPQETEGLTGPGWRDTMHDFYTLEGATKLHEALQRWDGGRLVVNIVEMPIKCPIAPLEFVFLADWYFQQRGIRDKVEIVLATPLDGAFTRPLAAKALGDLLEQKGIELVTDFNAGEVDGEHGKLMSWDERVEDFDLLVSIPLHMGADFVSRSPGLGDDMNFIFTDQATLQAKVKDNIFALGDATNLPTSKAGSVAHFEAEVLEQNIRRYLAGEALEEGFDGHANCFIETGFNKAVLIDFNYDIQPLPGRFPFAGVGPLSLLKETRMNHIGKMWFRWVYWHMLLPGRDMPGVPARMSLRGKQRVDLPPPERHPVQGGSANSMETDDDSARVA